MFEVNCRGQLRPQFDFWTEDQCLRLHQATLEVLERTGVKVLEEESLSLLKEAGCLVKEELVRIPPSLVEWAIRSAPERIVLSSADGKRSIFLEENTVSYGLGNDLPYFYDPRHDEIRPSRLQDVKNVSLVADKLDNIDFIASLALASDVTEELADLYHFKALRSYCQKPILASATGVDVLRSIYELGLITAGNKEEFRRSPNFAIYAEPTSPLIHSSEALKKLLFCAEMGIPITYASGVMSGATGPVTLAGSLVQGNAECLSGLIIHQLKQQGAPFILGIVAAPMDMQTTICLYGGPEVPLYHMAVGELGRYYGIPSYGISGCSDACLLDEQAAVEATFSIAAAAWSGTNLIHDNGYLGNGMIGNLEYLVMVDEIIDMTKHFMRGIEVNERTVPLDLIDEVGPGGHFLTADHTFRYFQEETWYPEYMNRAPFQDWLQKGKVLMEDLLKDRVQELLKEESQLQFNSSQLEEIDRIIEAEEKRVRIKRERGNGE